MSEYQYYEFQALDRPLTPEQMADLRQLSTRATITPTSLVNVYHYGDFRGDPLALMKTYFDAFLYVANWGTRTLMFRLPTRFLAADLADAYAVDHCLRVHPSGDSLILEFNSHNENEATWEEGEGWLDRLLPLREDIAAGDLRTLYLGWLACVELGALDDETLEPPVPVGLRELSPPLKALVTFLRVSEDLVAVAAKRSPAMPQRTTSTGDLQRWIHDMPGSEKDDLLLRAAQGTEPHLRTELLRRFREAMTPATSLVVSTTIGRRSAGKLLAAAEEHAKSRRQVAAERAVAKRNAYLDDLAGRQNEIWRQVEALVDMKRPADYDQAVKHLKQLQAVATRAGTQAAFDARVQQLRAEHTAKRGFLSRLNDAGLGRAQ